MIRLPDIPLFVEEKITRRKESLLAKDLKKYHAELSQALNGASLLVIGGAGTIGSHFIKAALQFEVKALYVVDTNENGLTELVRDLRSSSDFHLPQVFVTYPFNYGSHAFQSMLSHKGPFDVVANFAAHKHVRSEKDQFAIEAMIENNVLFAKNLLDHLSQNPPRHFFCVSTDKAANPVNVMGATKKLMEEVILAYKNEFKVTTARFANVAFSNGSLLDGFLMRFAKRQPLSSPSDVYRYFVSPKESGQLCLLACLIGQSGDIIFPKLDREKDVLSFSQIAENLLGEMGMEPDYSASEQEARAKALGWKPGDKKYPVYFFKTDTTGEKQIEEFYTKAEEVDEQVFEHLAVIKNGQHRSLEELKPLVQDFKALFSQSNLEKHHVIELLSHYLPNFFHVETGKYLDQKM